MVLPLVPIIGYAFTAITAVDIGLMLTTDKDIWQHTIGWSPYDWALGKLGLGGGEIAAPVADAVDASGDLIGMILKAGVLALGVLIIWSRAKGNKPKPKKKGGRR